MTHGALLAFGPYVLDTTRRSLTRDGEEVLLGELRLREGIDLRDDVGDVAKALATSDPSANAF